MLLYVMALPPTVIETGHKISVQKGKIDCLTRLAQGQLARIEYALLYFGTVVKGIVNFKLFHPKHVSKSSRHVL